MKLLLHLILNNETLHVQSPAATLTNRSQTTENVSDRATASSFQVGRQGRFWECTDAKAELDGVIHTGLNLFMTRQLLNILMFYIGDLSAIHASKYHDLGELPIKTWDVFCPVQSSVHRSVGRKEAC